MIGTFGSLRFRVSDDRMLTFSDFSREISGTWNTTERIRGKPMTEFGGPKLQTISLKIILDANLGIRPRAMLSQIETMVETGSCHTLIIGKKVVGKNKWVIVKSSESWDTVLHRGELVRASVTLSLQEYC